MNKKKIDIESTEPIISKMAQELALTSNSA